MPNHNPNSVPLQNALDVAAQYDKPRFMAVRVVVGFQHMPGTDLDPLHVPADEAAV